MIKKALLTLFNNLIALDKSLWMQIGGMSVSLSFGAFIFTLYKTSHTSSEITLVLLIELLIILFSVLTFSTYLSNKGAASAAKLGLRKTLGTTGWRLFLEISIQTTVLVILSILFSVGIMDVSLLMAGLSFETIINSIGVIEYGILLLSVFILSEAALFIIQAIALAPQIKSDYNATAIFEKTWFLKIGKTLLKVSFVLLILISLLLVILLLFFISNIAIKVQLILHYTVLCIWYYNNKRLV